MDYNTKTFCSAAWFGIRNEQFGNFQVCSKIDTAASEFEPKQDLKWPAHSVDQFLNSDYVQYIRQHLTAGAALPECHRCWQQEAHGHASGRTISNNTVTGNRGHDLSNTWVHAYITRKQDYTSDHLIAVDVKLTNTCNFSCSSCNPADSSKIYTAWAANPDHPIIKLHLDSQPDYLSQVRSHFVEKNNHQLLTELLLKRPKHIKLLGGEPLLDRVVLDMLATYPVADNTKLSFVTNGSVDLLATTEKLNRYQNVHYTVSLDGIGAYQDYLRKGSNWQQISKNIIDFAARYPANINVHATAQALNVGSLELLLEWCQTHHLPLTIGMVEQPEYLSMAVLPPELRDVAALSAWPEHTGALVEQVNNTPHQPQLLQQLKQFFNWYDPEQRWRQLLPEWQPYLD